MHNPCTEAEFLALIDRHPRLCAMGWWAPESPRALKVNLEASRQHLRNSYREFRHCLAWLSRCQKTETVEDKSPGSQNLKHRVEAAVGEYIGNGALVAAALFLKLPIKFHDNSAYPQIGISRNCPVFLSAQKSASLI